MAVSTNWGFLLRVSFQQEPYYVGSILGPLHSWQLPNRLRDHSSLMDLADATPGGSSPSLRWVARAPFMRRREACKGPLELAEGPLLPKEIACRLLSFMYHAPHHATLRSATAVCQLLVVFGPGSLLPSARFPQDLVHSFTQRVGWIPRTGVVV